MPKRFPPFVYSRGEEPDPRFSLANERTFLAWIRTSLAFVAAGVALEALVLPIDPTLRLVAAVIFIALGIVSAAFSWASWARTELALRVQQALPGPTIAAVVTIGVLAAIMLIGLGLLL
jgi:putative membrane protein